MIQEQSRLLSLSTELLLLILDYIHNQALLTISSVSRRLHHLALPIYLLRHGITNPDPTSLVLQGQTILALPGLRSSFSITSLDSLFCKFEGPHESDFTWGVTHLLQFVRKLRRVDAVTLHLGNIDARWIDGLATASSNAWNPMFLRLLDMILETKCSILTVTHGNFIPKGGAILNQKVAPRESTSVVRAKMSLGLSLSIRRRKPLVERGPPRNDLKSLCIHSNMLLSPSFCDWTMHTLNTCDITSLSIRLSGIPPETWALILSTITIPSLSKFTAETIDIAFPDLIGFLARHPLIHTLHFHPYFSYPHSSKRPRRPKRHSILPKLASLGGSPGNLTALFAHLPPYPQLHTIALSFPMHQRVFQPSDFEKLGWYISGAVHGVTFSTLSLRFSVPYEMSNAAAMPGLTTAATACRGVETLAFSTDGHFAFARWVVPVLPAWLADFAALRHVWLAEECVSEQVGSRGCLVGAIKARCPGVRTVTFGDMMQGHVG